MYQISGVTTDPLQKQTLTLPSGLQIVLTLYFMPQQYCWMIRELNYDNGVFVISNLRVTASLNMLNQFRNKIPFGLACVSVGSRDPQQQEDFSSGNCKLYVLTEDEVASYTEYLGNG